MDMIIKMQEPCLLINDGKGSESEIWEGTKSRRKYFFE
jgi:hypothetical protein